MDAPKVKPLAVVTGASSGIGYALARQFALHQHDLLICAEDQGGLVEARQALVGIGVGDPCQVEICQADLRRREGVEALYRAIQGLDRPVDVLCANAGVGVGGDFARETDLEAELDMIQLNVTSQVHLVKLVLRDMLERNRGRILITSSVAGVLPGPREAVYAGTKAFLHSFAEAIRNELKDTGITVTALLPGPTETNYFHRAGLDDTKVGRSEHKDDPADVAREAYEALMAGRDHVVTGARNKLQVGMSGVRPDTAKAAVHGQMTTPADREGRPEGRR
jgi:short-subunit dehydrogenase